MGEATKAFRPWDRVVISWNVEYRGYQRGDDDRPEGPVGFHVTLEIREAVIVSNNPKQRRRRAGKRAYRLTVTHAMAPAGEDPDSSIVYEEPFTEQEIKKAYDAFQREVLNVQSWVVIAEPRARIIPQANDVFECHHCGWVTDIWRDDITCEGCGRRYWSERIWNRWR